MKKIIYYMVLLIPWLLCSQTPITDANFHTAISICLSTNPVDGMCLSSEYGAIPYWDVSKVTNMSQAFKNYSDFNGDISTWDVSNVTDMSEMFSWAGSFNQNIGNWNVSKVTDMSWMFVATCLGDNSFDQDISSWDVSNVTNMSYMFATSDFNQPIGNWDVSNVSDMSGMFAGSMGFDQDIGNWDVGNVTTMRRMFSNASELTPWPNIFNREIGNWNVSNVTDMEGMFGKAIYFNQYIGDWDVSNVTNMSDMFIYSESFDQDLGGWNISNVTDMTMMFHGTQLSTDNYDSILDGWAALPGLQLNVTFDGGLSNYCNGGSSRSVLINTYGWTIIDGGMDCTASIEELEVSGIKIYPNPVENTLYIDGFEGELWLMVFDTLGKKLVSAKVVAEVDMRSLSPGIYIIKLIDKDRLVSRKLIKK